MRAAAYLAAFAAAVWWAAPLAAQDVAFSPEATEACLDVAAGAGRRECIGVSARACMATQGGSTTVGTGYCLGAERDWWDDRLNTAYRALMAREKAIDQEVSGAGRTEPARAAALRDMQRAWIGWRDAACAYEFAQWGGGSGGAPAYAGCQMRLTGEQALALEGRLEDGAR